MTEKGSKFERNVGDRHSCWSSVCDTECQSSTAHAFSDAAANWPKTDTEFPRALRRACVGSANRPITLVPRWGFSFVLP